MPRYPGGGSFPTRDPYKAYAVYLPDAIEADIDFESVMGWRRREFYRFYESGLFVLGRVASEDMNRDGSYVSGDWGVGYLELIRTIAQISDLAAGFARLFGETTVATVAVHGLTNHKLIDDSKQHLLFEPRRIAHAAGVKETWNGEPADFAEKRRDWGAQFTRKVLRLLNWPDITEQTIREWQSKVANG